MSSSDNFTEQDFDRKGYNYELPESFIAQTPREPRESARVLVYKRETGEVSHTTVGELPALLAKENLHWVFNNTKVLRARLKGVRMLTTPQGEQAGGKVEFFLVERIEQENFVWRGIMKSSASIGPGFRFMVGSCLGIVIETQKLDASLPVHTAVFDKDPLLYGQGEVPLPPYIGAAGTQEDLDQIYNTPFAKVEGAVAAPTAGRHFTSEVIEGFRQCGHGISELTLHVGIGTFLPVKTHDIREHIMHSERASVDVLTASEISVAREDGRKVVAVGTTSARTLEAFTDLDGHTASGYKNVNIFIYPGYQWKGVDVLFTNFHLPESTLLMMVSSFIGSRAKTLALYEIAKREKYRFFSFGDAMIIL